MWGCLVAPVTSAGRLQRFGLLADFYFVMATQAPGLAENLELAHSFSSD